MSVGTLHLSLLVGTIFAMSSDKPRFRLIYYQFRGRAELVRFTLEHLNIPYIDQRISFEKWAERKPGILL